ncbi:rhodanese-like domain-containing protein [Breznakiella homolactica]|uniref:Rhodanese-like domain-containing protein n=1 Tax=Breznakiella homolactica TaxID=2798577 RepID=A0A7T7XJH4_9SPIR|nr:rhodanese-like domain-containing protein [Breznakiella homolactica]QQO07435.1 rhodanese-like domain-containing protein [Breznakiella homolactica]
MQLSQSEIVKKIQDGAMIVDVRSDLEYQTGAYPGAVNIPVESIPANLEKLEPKDRLILTYCASGMRGNRAVTMLESFGWTDVWCAGALRNMPQP